MTDTEYAARVDNLTAKFRLLGALDQDDLVAYYEAISASIGLQIPENHAQELFIAASSETWATGYKLFGRTLTRLLAAQMAGLAAAFYFKAPQQVLLLLPALLTFLFALLYVIKGSLIARGAQKLDDGRSYVVREFIDKTKAGAKAGLERRLAAATEEE